MSKEIVHINIIFKKYSVNILISYKLLKILILF